MKKQLFLIPIVALGASLASCGGNKKPATYDVSLNMTEAMNIDKVTATAKKDFDAKISIKDDFTGYCEMPTKLYEVHVDGVLLEEGEQYTYTRDSDNEARLHIPSKNVTGDIEIYTEAKAEDIQIKYSSSDNVILHDKETAIVGSSSVIHLSLSKEHAKNYSVPNNLSDLVVTCVDAKDHKLYDLTRCCTYEKRDDASSKLTIPAKYNDEVVITGEINIVANYHQPIYTIEEGELFYLEMDCPNKVKKGEAYSFTITPTDTHGIPQTLDIKVGGIPLSKEAGDYEIVKNSIMSSESATVKIKADKVTDNIVVSGSGTDPIPVIPVKYYLGGIIEPKQIEVKVEQPFSCKLDVEEGISSKVTKNDIRVRIGDKKDPDAWEIPGKNGIIFNENTHELIIAGERITDPSSEIHIAAKAHSVKLLEFYSSYGDWASIETASNLGYAQYLFEIGEESVPFSIGSDTYRIRIIGFNSDLNYQYGNTAGITFEFTSCVSQQYFGKSVSGKTNSSYFYKPKTGALTYQSEMYDYLNTTLLDALPFKKYINSVSKFTVAGSYSEAITVGDQDKAVESPNYLFPLSLKELKLEPTIEGEFDKEGTGESHDSTYEYYKKANQSLIKTYGGKPVTYWLRSPANVKQPQIYTINTDGHRASAPARGQKLYVAPAFCF